MVFLNEFELGDGDYKTGHTVYPKAKIKTKNGRRFIVKANKHQLSEYSRFEVALTDLSRLFLAPHLTAKAQLVAKENNDIFGLAVEHYAYQAMQREMPVQQDGLNTGSVKPPVFYNITTEGDSLLSYIYFLKAFDPNRLAGDFVPEPTAGITAAGKSGEEKSDELPPVFFLNQFPHGFFASLYALEKEQKEQKEKSLTFDWASLASVMASSYTLEEDDLHKGNIGFYLVKGKNDSCPRVVFFSIDHDLKLGGSIMSYYCPRIKNKHRSDGPYKITAYDLINLPYIRDSQNYYWPTRWRFWLNFYDSKVYINQYELKAFADLADRLEFQKEKWQAFYKHVLIPPERLREIYRHSFDEDNTRDRAIIDLFTDAIVDRQAQLRAVLFSVPQFREQLQNFSDQQKLRILQEIAPDNLAMRNSIKKQMDRESELINPFVPGDTPLHAAVRLGDYRYQQTWVNCREYASMLNSKGETALDIALKKARQSKPHGCKDIRQDAYATARHLYDLGVPYHDRYKKYLHDPRALVPKYMFYSSYLKEADKAGDRKAIISVLAAIGREDSYCLKLKKQVAVLALRKFLASQLQLEQKDRLPRAEMNALMKALNGKGKPSENDQLHYIRQMRSRYWITRKIRALLGGSTTQLRMRQMIKRYLSPKTGVKHGFNLFGSGSRKEQQAEAEKNKPPDNHSP